MDASLELQIAIAVASLATLVIPVVKKTIRRSDGKLTRSGWIFVVCAILSFALNILAWVQTGQAEARSEKEIASIREDQRKAALKIEPTDFQIYVFTLANPPFDQLDRIEKGIADHSVPRPELIQVAGRIGDKGSYRSVPISFDLVPIPARRVLMRRVGGYIDLTYQARNFALVDPGTFSTLADLKGQTLSFALPVEKLEFFKGQWLESAELYVKGRRYDGIARRLENEVVFNLDETF
jgi:hypothetical protein